MFVYLVFFASKNMLKRRREGRGEERDLDEVVGRAIELPTTGSNNTSKRHRVRVGRIQVATVSTASNSSGHPTPISYSSNSASTPVGSGGGSRLSVASFSSQTFSTLNNTYSVDEKDEIGENERKLGTVEEEKEVGNENENENENRPHYFIEDPNEEKKSDDESTLVPTLPPSTLGREDSRNFQVENEEEKEEKEEEEEEESSSPSLHPTTYPTSSTQPETRVSSERTGKNWHSQLE